jgi:adenylate cyclase
MAFWNAPLENKAHARDAVLSALQCQEAIAELNKNLDPGLPETPAIRIGINTGQMNVGFTGTERKLAYTVIGDEVNLASRLEGQSKTYAVPIIISEETQRLAPDFAALELDLIAVKGKKDAVRIFALLGEPEVAARDAFVKLRCMHMRMLNAYRQQSWDEASALLGECRALDDDLDDLYDVYRTRIAAMRQDPPGPDWDGVFVATSK